MNAADRIAVAVVAALLAVVVGGWMSWLLSPQVPRASVYAEVRAPGTPQTSQPGR